MPKKYSVDLRWRIVWQHLLQGKSIETVARDMYVCTRSVERSVQLFKRTGDVSACEQKHGPSRKLNDFEEITLLQTLLDAPGIYLREVQEEMYDVFGTWVHCSTICRTAKALGLTRQKMKREAIQRSEERRAEFMAEISAFSPDMLVFLDETGSDRRNSIRQFGYGLRGVPPISQHLRIWGRRISGIGMLTTRGMEDVYIAEGSVNVEIFLQFVQRNLLPFLNVFDDSNPRSVVIMDNASIHHVEEVVAMIRASGALVRFLPPYSPDLNPIEEAFSKVKSFLRDNDNAYQVTESPRVFVAEAFASVTQEDCLQYIKHSGYMD